MALNRYRYRLLLPINFFLIVLLSVNAHSQISRENEELIILPRATEPVADAYVDSRTWNNIKKANFGASDNLIVGLSMSGNGSEKRAYLRFDLPKASSVEKAILRLYLYRVNNLFGLRLGIDVKQVLKPWKEGTGYFPTSGSCPDASAGEIIWQRQPISKETGISWYSDGILSTGQHKIPYWIRIDVTSLVNQWLAGSVNQGLMLQSRPFPSFGSENHFIDWILCSRECVKGQRPILELTYPVHVKTESFLNFKSSFADSQEGNISDYIVTIKLNGKEIFKGNPQVERGMVSNGMLVNLRDFKVPFNESLLKDGQNSMEIGLYGVDSKYWFCWDYFTIGDVKIESQNRWGSYSSTGVDGVYGGENRTVTFHYSKQLGGKPFGEPLPASESTEDGKHIDVGNPESEKAFNFDCSGEEKNVHKVKILGLDARCVYSKGAWYMYRVKTKPKARVRIKIKYTGWDQPAARTEFYVLVNRKRTSFQNPRLEPKVWAMRTIEGKADTKGNVMIKIQGIAHNTRTAYISDIWIESIP